MSEFSTKDYIYFKRIASAQIPQLGGAIIKVLKKAGYQVITGKGYIYAEGKIPIAVVAHLDTVFPMPPTKIYYDREEEIVWSPDGLGADDRAGVYAIFKLLQDGYRPSVIFTTGEERGGIGAENLSNLPCPFSSRLKYIIELDRRNEKDCVFYECDNKDFVKYIENFEYEESPGLFSDISIICPAWGIAGVNLSIGYQNEHTYSETLNVKWLNSSIKKVEKLLDNSSVAEEYRYISGQYLWPVSPEKIPDQICCICKKKFSFSKGFLVEDANEKFLFYCSDCLPKETKFCKICGGAFAPFETTVNGVCRECIKEYIGEDELSV